MSRLKVVTVSSSQGLAGLLDLFGPVVDVSIAGFVAGVSPTRIYNLIAEGRLSKLVLWGAQHVSLRELAAWELTRNRRLSRE